MGKKSIPYTDDDFKQRGAAVNIRLQELRDVLLTSHAWFSKISEWHRDSRGTELDFAEWKRNLVRDLSRLAPLINEDVEGPPLIVLTGLKSENASPALGIPAGMSFALYNPISKKTTHCMIDGLTAAIPVIQKLEGALRDTPAKVLSLPRDAVQDAGATDDSLQAARVSRQEVGNKITAWTRIKSYIEKQPKRCERARKIAFDLSMSFNTVRNAFCRHHAKDGYYSDTRYGYCAPKKVKPIKK